MSPEVWDDAIPRIQAVADLLGITFEMPNEDAGPRPSPPQSWVQIEVAADQAGPMQIGYDAWEERGEVYISLMVPVGAGLRPYLVQRKQFSLAFRGINQTLTNVGLIYSDNQTFDALGQERIDGMYLRLPLIVRYTYHDQLTNPPPQ
jgi:hypothetical protein